MTYQEFKNNYSFDTGKGHINFYNKAKDELYKFFDIFYQNHGAYPLLLNK